MQDQDFWGTVDAQFFLGEFVLLALGTVPGVALLQKLRLLKLLKALFKTDLRNIPINFRLRAHNLKILHTLKLKPLPLLHPHINLAIPSINLILQ